MELAALDLDFEEIYDFKPIFKSALNSSTSFLEVIDSTQIRESLADFSDAKKLLIYLAFLESACDFEFKLETLKLSTSFLFQIKIDGLIDHNHQKKMGDGEVFLCCSSGTVISKNNQLIASRVDFSEISSILLGYLAGAVSTALKIALSHLQVRHQFSKPVGSFQLVQDHVVSCFNVFEIIKSHIMLLDKLSDRSRAYLNLLCFLQNHGIAEVDRLIQACGGMGFTKEFRLNHFLSRFREILFFIS